MIRLRLWPGMVFILLGMNVCVVTVTIVLANSDPSFSVEPDYDAKALAWNDAAAQGASNRALGWTPRITHTPGGVSLHIERRGEPLSGARVSALAFAGARSADRRVLTFVEGEPGVYTAPLGEARGGLWHFRVRAVHGGDTFTASLECDLPGVAR